MAKKKARKKATKRKVGKRKAAKRRKVGKRKAKRTVGNCAIVKVCGKRRRICRNKKGHIKSNTPA